LVDLKKKKKHLWKDFCKDCTFCNDPLTNIATVSDWPIFTTLLLRLIWLSGFRGEDLKKMANQKKELSLVAMFVNGSGQNVQSL
jgi:hypothetical protein